MASISGTVTVAGDPDDWIACAFDADTHAYAGSAAVSAGAYEITGLTAGKAYMIACRCKTGGAWQADYGNHVTGDLCVPTDPETTPYLYEATAVATGDEYWDNVVLLLRCNGSQGGTTFTDDAGHTVTANGDAITYQSEKKYGNASLKCDGSGDYLLVADSADFDIAQDEDVTIECWFNVTNLSSDRYLIHIPAGSNPIRLFIPAVAQKLRFETPSGVILSTSTVSTSAWHHAAAVRSSGTWTVYLDGAAGATLSDNRAFQPTNIRVGVPSDTSGHFLGYIDDVRITIGTARYTAAFTPPAEEFLPTAVAPTGSTEPTWPTTDGDTVVDNGVTWTCRGRLVQPLIQGPLIAA